MKTIITLIVLCTGVFAQAQMATIQAEFNNFRWMTSLNGSMFHNQATSNPGLEIPINSGNHALFAANLWIGGLDDEDNMRVTAARFCQFGVCQLGPGPLKLNGTVGSWELEDSPYNRFWKANKEEVDAHLAYFDCVNDPSCDAESMYPGGYTPPADFVTWPAMGDTEDGFAEYLAPFYDYNNDGVYNAENGDHPLFCGDMVVYSITNDVGFRPDDPTFGQGLGVEVHSTYYAFYSEAPELFNSIFVNKRIINRSGSNYHDVYLGFWSDFDLGNPYDDYVGTDVQRSMIYVYNGTDFDEGSVVGPGYGDDIPALGMRILQGPLKDANGLDDAPLSDDYSRYGNQTSGWGDGIADNERLGLMSSVRHYNSGEGAPAPTTEPLIPTDYYNYMRALWKDGTPLAFINPNQPMSGLGYDTSSTALPALYMYPALSDPLNAGTGGIIPEFSHPDGWRETSSGNPPGDRRMLASSGPFSLNAGEEQQVDFAYIFARDSHEPGTPVFETLQSYADAIVGMECGQLPQIVTSIRDVRAELLGFRLFPNPTRNMVTLESQRYNVGHFSVFDLLGKVVMQGNTTGSRTELSVSHLPKGLYLIRYEVDAEAAVQKLMVE